MRVQLSAGSRTLGSFGFLSAGCWWSAAVVRVRCAKRGGLVGEDRRRLLLSGARLMGKNVDGDGAGVVKCVHAGVGVLTPGRGADAEPWNAGCFAG